MKRRTLGDLFWVAASTLTLCAVLQGCATTSGLPAQVTKSGFDGSVVVDIEPHGNDCTSMTCTGLGAQWSSSTPGRAILKVQVFNDISAITGAKLRIDGQVMTLDPLPGLTRFNPPASGMKASSKSYAVDLSDLRRLAAAERAWLRVSTSKGYIEDRIVDGGRDSKSLHAIRRFLEKVDQESVKQ